MSWRLFLLFLTAVIVLQIVTLDITYNILKKKSLIYFTQYYQLEKSLELTGPTAQITHSVNCKELHN